jgi:hypothetical protein
MPGASNLLIFLQGENSVKKIIQVHPCARVCLGWVSDSTALGVERRLRIESWAAAELGRWWVCLPLQDASAEWNVVAVKLSHTPVHLFLSCFLLSLREHRHSPGHSHKDHNIVVVWFFSGFTGSGFRLKFNFRICANQNPLVHRFDCFRRSRGKVV